jgi:hypothetical protein
VLPDGGFLCQISKILADLKVICRAKNISRGLPITSGFLADLTNYAQALFVWRIWWNSSGFVVSIFKN